MTARAAGHVFSRSELASMSQDDFEDNQAAIEKQMRGAGIPDKPPPGPSVLDMVNKAIDKALA